MPTYSYKCDACEQRFDRFQAMSDAPIQVCPHCGQSRVRRLITGGGGLIFKGSGFYITDYARKPGKESDADPPAKAETAAKDEKDGHSTPTKDGQEKHSKEASKGVTESPDAKADSGKTAD